MTTAAPDFDSPRAWAIDAAVCVVAGIVLGVLGPFGSFFNGDLLPRLLQWTLSSLAIAIVYGAALRAVRPFARRHRIPAWAWVSAVVLIAALPVSAATRVASIAVWPFLAKVSWLDWYGQAVITTLPLTAIYIFLRVRLAEPRPAAPVAETVQVSDGGEPAGEPAADQAVGDTPFLRRLPPRLGRDIVCLVMEDHYVRAHTALGSDLILLPLHKAVDELGGLEGMQVHRSWWVARTAVQGTVEDGRNIRLRLTNGMEAPVARTAVARLRAAGWL